MAFVAIPNTASAVIHYLMFGKPMAIVLYVTKPSSGPFTLEEMTTIAGDIGAVVDETMLTIQSHDLLVDNITVTDLTLAGGAQLVWQDTDWPKPGVVNQDSLPGGSAFVVKHLTGRVGRSFRGRSYVMGIPENHNQGGVVTNAWAGAMRVAFDAIDSALAGDGFTHVIISRRFNGVVRTVPLAIPVTSNAYTTTAIRSQRRRNVS